MKIAGRTEELHIYDVQEEDRGTLKSLGYEYLEDDICDNEIWGREENFYVGKVYICSNCFGMCRDDNSPDDNLSELVFRDDNTFICEKCSIDYEEVDGVIKRRDNTQT